MTFNCGLSNGRSALRSAILSDFYKSTSALVRVAFLFGTGLLVSVLMSCGGGGGGGSPVQPTPTPVVTCAPFIDGFGQSVTCAEMNALPGSELAYLERGGGGADSGDGDSGGDGDGGDGAPIANTQIKFIDINGKSVITTTNSSGYFRINLRGLQAPLVATVLRDSKPWKSMLVQDIVRAPANRNFYTINLTGLTDLVASEVAKKEGLNGTEALTPAAVARQKAQIPAIITDLNGKLGTQVSAAGLNGATFNPLTTPFKPVLTDSYDKLLESVSVERSSTGFTVATPVYKLTGTITGLGAATGLVVSNGAELATVLSASFSFKSVAAGTLYDVKVQAQPSALVCSITNGLGVMGTSDVTALAVVCSPKPAATNGACGASHLATLSSAPTTNLCSGGTESAISGNGPWNWSCVGSNGGTSATCQAAKVPTVNLPTCGSANLASFTSAPATNLCSSGSASAVSGSGPWTWSCAGLSAADGSPVSCSAKKTTNGACGSSNSLFLSSAPSTNLCDLGAASSVSGSGPWSWSCAGSNGGTTASCAASSTTNGECGTANASTSLTAPTSNFCKVGTTSLVTGTGPWSWTCASVNGGSTASCAASKTANGECGSANASTSLTAPTSNLCNVGTTSLVTGTGPWNWTCASTNGGTNATCSASKASTAGECGSSNLTAQIVAPTTNLCSAGTATAVSGVGPWSWNCTGLNGGPTASCSASKAVVAGKCGSSNNLSLYATPTTNLCSTGSATTVLGSGPWTWSCSGINGGGSDLCSAKKAVDGACGSFIVSDAAASCLAGTASLVTGSGPWSWTCSGTNGGTTAACTADRSFKLGGYAYGLSSTVVLANGSQTTNASPVQCLVAPCASPFQFLNPIVTGSSYNVTVQTQPTNQTCTVTAGAGVMPASDVSSVVVNCVDSGPVTFKLSGTASGLTGSGLSLAYKIGNLTLNIPVTLSGSFSSANVVITAGTSYTVTVQTQPTGQTCSVSNGSGVAINGTNSSLLVTCTP